MSGKKGILCAVIFIVVALLAGLGGYQWSELRWAHSSFNNYYAFRGCTELLASSTTDGTCKTASGATLKIVELNGKWYLDGDLPWGCIGSLCLGW